MEIYAFWLLVLVGLALLVSLPLVFVFGILLGAKGRFKLGGFYTCWIAALALAVILPIAIPAAIWPPSYYDDASGSGDCASIAKDYAADGMPPMVLYPVKATTIRCTGLLADSGFGMFVNLEARGPYGIPFATARVTETDIQHFREDGSGELVGMLALIAGMAAVSLPFGFVLLQRHLRVMRPAAVA